MSTDMLSTMFHDSIARDRQRTLRAAGAQTARPRRAPAPRPRLRPAPPRPAPAVSIRWAGPGDIPALEGLAVLDSTRLPQAPVLVAERDGRIVAALPLAADARAIADPFERTVELVDLLELRAAQLVRPERPRPSGRGHRALLPHRAV